jgi:hypothetical protein
MSGAQSRHDSHLVDGEAPPMPRDASLTEYVAAVLGTLSVCAITYLAIVDGSASAQTALTGLVGATASYFLTPKIARSGTGNGSNGRPTV